MDNFNTFEVSDRNLLYDQQAQFLDKMKSAMLSVSNSSSPQLSSSAIKQVVLLRTLHTLNRIIMYTELMDKLEHKLYSSIMHEIKLCDDGDADKLYSLLAIQEKLQKSISESVKLLQPFAQMADSAISQFVQEATITVEASDTLEASEREKLRNSANAVLKELKSCG